MCKVMDYGMRRAAGEGNLAHRTNQVELLFNA